MPVQYRKNALAPLVMLADAATLPFAVNTTKAIFKLWSVKKSKPGKKAFPLCIDCRKSLFIVAPSASPVVVQETLDNTIVEREAKSELGASEDIVEHVHNHSDTEQCACCANLTNFVLEFTDDEEEPASKDVQEDIVSETSSTTISSLHQRQTISDSRQTIEKEDIQILPMPHEEPVLNSDPIPTVSLVTETTKETPVETPSIITPPDEIHMPSMNRTPPPSIKAASPVMKPKDSMEQVQLLCGPLPHQSTSPASPIISTSPQQQQPQYSPISLISSPAVPPAPAPGLKRRESFLKRKTSSAQIKATAWWNKVQSKFTHKEQS